MQDKTDILFYLNNDKTLCFLTADHKHIFFLNNTESKC